MATVTAKSDGLRWDQNCSDEDLKHAAAGKNVIVVGGTKVGFWWLHPLPQFQTEYVVLLLATSRPTFRQNN